MDDKQLILSLNSDLAIALPENESLDKLRLILSAYINELIDKNFQHLVNLLYRLDVSEYKLKQMLSDTKEDAGLVIADLIIERQTEKIKTRKQFQQKQEDIDENEKW